MARSINVILDSMLLEKENQPALASLNSTSKVAIWRLWLWIVAAAIHFHELIFDKHKEEVEAIARQNIAGKLEWYAAEALKFQYGYGLAFDNQAFRYYYIDSTSDAAVASKIIRRVACKEVFSSTFSGIRIKVAKQLSGSLLPLDNSELTAFTYYIKKIAFAGVAIDVISLPADVLQYNIKVFYDGYLEANTILTSVEYAINAYLSELEFDGVFYRNKLEDYIQILPGVRDIEIVRLAQKPGLSSSFSDIGRKHEPTSGYMVTAPIGSDINDSKIQLIPE